MANIERVFALHDFEAENPDEVSFKAGEPVVVVEKDDAYGDGWWQVSLHRVRLRKRPPSEPSCTSSLLPRGQTGNKHKGRDWSVSLFLHNL